MARRVGWIATLFSTVAVSSLVAPAGGLAPVAVAASLSPAEGNAESHIQKGLELRRQNRDKEALAEFEEAERLFPSARAKAQVGLAQMAVGVFESAEQTLLGVLASSGDDPWVKAHRAALEEAVEKIRDHLGTLNVGGDPRGAAVEVDGRAAGSVPCSVRVQAGEAVVKVAAPGFLPIRRKISIEARQVSSQVFTLVRTTGEDATTPLSNQLEPAKEREPADRRASSPWPWITAGASVVALSLGTIEAFRWAAKASEFDNLKDGNGNLLCGAQDPNNGGSTCSGLLDQGRQARALSLGGFAVGAALGVTSAILFARSRGDADTNLSCAPVGPSSLGCVARF